MNHQHIKLGTVIRAKEDIKGGSGKEINSKFYYTYDQATETAQQQGLTIPTKQDFLDSGFTEERTEENKKLADKLGLTLDGYCDSDGTLQDDGEFGCRWSASSKGSDGARYFAFGEAKGGLGRYDRSGAMPVRPLFKNSSDNSSLGLVDKIVQRAEKYGATLGAKAGRELGVLLDDKTDDGQA